MNSAARTIGAGVTVALFAVTILSQIDQAPQLTLQGIFPGRTMILVAAVGLVLAIPGVRFVAKALGLIGDGF